MLGYGLIHFSKQLGGLMNLVGTRMYWYHVQQKKWMKRDENENNKVDNVQLLSQA